MKVHLITSCSSTRMIAPKVRVQDMHRPMTMEGALTWWTEQIRDEEPSITAREQYRGLGFNTLVRIQNQFPLESVKVITGGLGLTDLDDMIVPYDFSASVKEEHNIQQVVTSEPFVQSVWWANINKAFNKGPTPIADLVREHPENYVIVSAGKVFLRYVAEDVLSLNIEERKRIRILLAASSQGSVPMQLRPMMLPFPRGSINHIPGNRNDGNHRAAQLFLSKAAEMPEFLHLEPSKQLEIAFLQGQQTTGNMTMGTMSKLQVEKILQEHPEYLKMQVEEAYKVIRREHGAIGGRTFFKGLFRAAGGEVISHEASQEELQKAASALQGLDFLTGDSQKTSEEDETLKVMAIFIQVLKDAAPKAIFTAANVVSWADKYFADKEDMPPALSSPNKLNYILKSNADLLGLIEHEIPGGKGFSVKEG